LVLDTTLGCLFDSFLRSRAAGLPLVAGGGAAHPRRPVGEGQRTERREAARDGSLGPARRPERLGRSLQDHLELL